MSQRSVSRLGLHLGLLALLSWSGLVAAGTPQDSVVRVIADNQVGTGFVWQGQQGKRYIVTSLHTLAGVSQIFYEKPSASTMLEVYRYDTESDLALLVPVNGALTLPALNIAAASPDRSARYYIYGFPAGVKRVQGDSIEFSLAEHNIAMADYLPNKVLGDVTAAGFPQPSLKVLRVSSGITPGHSGAPIVDARTNAVIGIGAGGLSKQGFRRVNWAVPAQTYLTLVESRGQTGSTARLSPPADRQYHHSVSEGGAGYTAGADPDDAGQMNAGSNKYYKIYAVPLDELVDGLNAYDEENPLVDAETIAEVAAHAAEVGVSPSEITIDVYQNSQTGAMIFVPEYFTLSSANNMLVASAAEGAFQMYFHIDQAGSYAAAEEVADAYINFIRQQVGEAWELEPETPDDPYEMWGEGWWDFRAWASETDPDSSETLGQMLITMQIEHDDELGYGDFLGTAVMGQYMDQFDERDHLLLRVMDVCASMAGFAP